MTVTLDLKPEVEEHLKAEAKARGVSVEDYIQQELESKLGTSAASEAVPYEEWLRRFNEWVNSHDYIKAPHFQMKRLAGRAFTASVKMHNCEVPCRFERVIEKRATHSRDVRSRNDALALLPANGNELVIVAQNLIEFWAVATRPIADNGLGITAAQAAQELTKLKTLFGILPDTADILPQWEQLVVKHQVLGKQVHDARLVAAMTVHKLTHLLTFNTDDFKRYDKITVVSPSAVK